MVDIAQLVSASDCGSEGRGFESHYPPQKKRTSPFGLVLFFWRHGDNGIRMAQATLSCCFAAIHLEPGPGIAGVKNSPGDCFSGRGRIQGSVTAVRRTVGTDPSVFRRRSVGHFPDANGIGGRFLNRPYSVFYCSQQSQFTPPPAVMVLPWITSAWTFPPA